MDIFHKKQFKMFQTMREQDSLAHAYLFTGPAGVGKYNFAVKLARALIETDNAQNHPDITKINAPFAVKATRGLIKKLSSTPYSGKYKIVIINNAEALGTETANTLLKTLEEPTATTLFFLITSSPRVVPDTIRSRCYEVKFGFVSDADIEEKLNTKQIQHLKQHWSGRPEIARKLLNDKAYLRDIKQYRADYVKFTKATNAERFRIAEKYAKIKDKAVLNDLLRVWMELTDTPREKKQLLQIYKTSNTTNANTKFLLNNFAINL